MHFRAIFGREGDLDLTLRRQLFRFRKQLFVDQLQWDLRVFGEEERDEFDTPDTIHSLLLRDDAAVGVFRAIRTDNPYLAESIFPYLAQIAPYPRRADAWEISRFGIHGATLSASANLFGLMFRFAQAVGSQSLVAITEPTFERAMRSHGIRTRRYGPPQPIGVDRRGRPLTGVAGEIVISAQGGFRFQQLMTRAQLIEVEDAADVLGRTRISA